MTTLISVHSSTAQSPSDARPNTSVVEATSASLALPQPATQSAVEVPPVPPVPVTDSHAQYYSPVSIILATCALITAIGRVLKPNN